MGSKIMRPLISVIITYTSSYLTCKLRLNESSDRAGTPVWVTEGFRVWNCSLTLFDAAYRGGFGGLGRVLGLGLKVLNSSVASPARESAAITSVVGPTV